ncbi:MAG: hypothetical protein RLZZ450_5119 [Pseudomonadota bacterium]|jgi:hypothetical protein
MRTLYALTGLTLARRLKRWLGGRLALVVGILVALLCRPFRSANVRKRTFKQNIEGVVSITSTGLASTATVLDVGGLRACTIRGCFSSAMRC